MNRLLAYVFGLTLPVLAPLHAFPAEQATEPDPALELAGVWEATRRLGPQVRGDLTITRAGDAWSAEIAGYSVDARAENGEIRFEIPGDRGVFRGPRVPDRERIVGHWIQPGIAFLGNRFASPVVLRPLNSDRWRGRVVPLDDDITLYLVVEKREDGTVDAFLRNPQFNLGVFMSIGRVVHQDGSVRLVGRYRFADEEQTLAKGSYHPDTGRLSLYFPFPSPDGTFDFVRIDDDDGANAFYPRDRTAPRYTYRPPAAEDDGWEVASLEQVGIARKPIEAFIRTIVEAPTESEGSPYIHGILVARHGKLVLEEYFHGYHRARPHETRSASKSLASTLAGIAIQEGILGGVDRPVYETILGDRMPSGLDPRKRRITVEHLMTMSTGLDCDDTDFSTRGNEDRMQGQTEEPDWHRYTLDLPMTGEPGKTSVYCSASSNLLGAVVGKVSGEWLPRYFHSHFAEPMQMGLYHMNLMPNGEAYMGGGIRWRPRDFLKLGQLMLDGGVWNGKRILGPEFVKRATSPLYESRGIQYGYAWWVLDYPTEGGTVRAFYAGGNGGQYVMGIPELNLVIAFFGGNYNDRGPIYAPRDDYIPDAILPAVGP